jgi:hypothetical protein
VSLVVKLVVVEAAEYPSLLSAQTTAYFIVVDPPVMCETTVGADGAVNEDVAPAPSTMIPQPLLKSRALERVTAAEPLDIVAVGVAKEAADEHPPAGMNAVKST